MVVDELYRNATEEGARSSFTFDSAIIEKALRNIQAKRINTRTTIDAGLFSEVQRIVSNAIDIGYDAPAGNSGFAQELKTNAEVWSAFKVHRMGRDIAARMLDEDGNLKSFEQFKADTKDIVDHQVGRWLRTEFDTAVKRAHRAAEMRQFIEEADVFPNIEWLPSTAVNPRESHMPFYHHIWPIDDPFWERHKPGDEWGCQCDWRATDEEPTDNTGLGDEAIKPSPGLGGNPARTGQLFSGDHPYFPSDCDHCAFKSTRLRIFTNKQKNCYQCANIIKAIKEAKLVPVIEEYERLRADENYTDVKIDRKSGGLKATHIGHNTDRGKKAQRFFGGRYTSVDLEIECQEQLYRLGHRVILCDESKQIGGNTLPAIDMEVDGVMMDIRSITGRGWYSHAMLDKNDQFRRYNRREDIPAKVETLCLYFHDDKLFSEVKMKKSINYFKFFRNNQGELITHHIRRIVCVIRGRNEILEYEVKKY